MPILDRDSSRRDRAVVAGLVTSMGVLGGLLAGGSPVRRLVGGCVCAGLPTAVTVSVLRQPRVGPADVVTAVRACLAGCAAASSLAPQRVGRRSWGVAAWAIPALALDAVDGTVARATDTESAAGARLDMETDAAVLLGLSLVAARMLAPWAVLIGGARYAFVAGSLVRPAWAGSLPPSRRRRVIAALQGVALGVALAPVVPERGAKATVAAATLLLATSFALDIRHLERRR